MRRRSISALLISLMIATVAGLGMNLGTRAQDATPPAGQQGGAPEGVSFVTLASGTIQVLSPGTANLVLGRIKLDPGATLPFRSDGSLSGPRIHDQWDLDLHY
jgi:hypothetical protein